MTNRHDSLEEREGAASQPGVPAPDFRYRIVSTPTIDRRLDSGLLERAIREHVVGQLDAETSVATGSGSSDPGVAGIGPDTLLEALLVSDQAFLQTVLPTMMEHSISLLAFYRGMVQPVAQRLGDMWCDDQIDFVKVEIISMRLRLMCSQLVERRAAGRTPWNEDERRRVLLAHTGRDQHTLGFTMAEAFFRDAGWQVGGGENLEPGPDYDEAISSGHYALVAIAFARHDACDPHQIVAHTRALAPNNVRVCLGGVAVLTDPERYNSAGADIVARDAPEAVREAERLIFESSGVPDDSDGLGKPMFD